MKLVKKYVVEDEDKKFDRYTRVPNKIISNNQLSLCSFKILISLLGCSKNFKPSMPWLIRTVGVSKRTLDKGVIQLKELGYLESKKIGYNDYEWTIFI